MTDTMTPEQRHKCMAAIKGKDTKPELMVRRYLHALGLRYGLHNRRLPGKPDIVLRRLKTVVFVHGCFWHGHEGCPAFRLPKSRVEYWTTKIARNRQRDNECVGQLRAMGWNVIVVWECEMKTTEQRVNTLWRLGRQLLEIRDNGTLPHYIPADYGYDDLPGEIGIAAEDNGSYGNPTAQ